MILSFSFPSAPPCALAGAAGPSPEQALRAALSLWEYGHSEYVTLTKLSKKNLHLLSEKYNGLDDSEKDSASLIFALNCYNQKHNDDRFSLLRTYRCSQTSFLVFGQTSVGSLRDLYALAFVKQEDREKARSFLNRYLNFWKAEARSDSPGIILATDDIEYISEILHFLEEGGYPK